MTTSDVIAASLIAQRVNINQRRPVVRSWLHYPPDLTNMAGHTSSRRQTWTTTMTYAPPGPKNVKRKAKKECEICHYIGDDRSSLPYLEQARELLNISD
jgi:hypothetical protein